jgi:hypothetical protein
MEKQEPTDTPVGFVGIAGPLATSGESYASQSVARDAIISIGMLRPQRK